MRVLLDECVPKRLKRELLGHDASTVVEMGWSGVKNGKLLALAAAEFDCFLTVDANIEKSTALSRSSHCSPTHASRYPAKGICLGAGA